MRRFRLNKGNYEKSHLHEYGETYELSHIDNDGDIWLKEGDGFGRFDRYCYSKNELTEVFDNPIQSPEGFLDRMHKDTDLGYFAGLAMNGIMSNPDWAKTMYPDDLDEFIKRVTSGSIDIAKELIKQLAEETK